MHIQLIKKNKFTSASLKIGYLMIEIQLWPLTFGTYPYVRVQLLSVLTCEQKHQRENGIITGAGKFHFLRTERERSYYVSIARAHKKTNENSSISVSYTHLTLPTNYSV